MAATLPARTSARVVQQTVGQMWRDLSLEQQQPYRTAYFADSAMLKDRAAKVAAAEDEAREKDLHLQQHRRTPQQSEVEHRVPELFASGGLVGPEQSQQGSEQAGLGDVKMGFATARATVNPTP